MLLDGSGLARGSAVPPDTLARLLLLAADGAHPALAPLLDGLPVAGFSGTLADRFGTGPPRRRRRCRARQDRHPHRGQRSGRAPTSVDGRPVVFVVMADQVPDGATLQARDDLDRFAAVLSDGAARRPKSPWVWGG